MIREIRLLPPLALARLGSSATPMDNYNVEVDELAPVGFRKLTPALTLKVDRATGAIASATTPSAPVRFKDGTRVKPIAPFLEVWCDRGDGVLRPLTSAILSEEGLTAASVQWRVRVANLKARRRTGAAGDAITADTNAFSTHALHALTGNCPNFVAGKTISFGDVQYIQPTPQFPQIRLRFTPGRGLVLGSTKEPPNRQVVQDIVYNDATGPWSRHRDSGALTTAPGGIYANENGVSRGYLDDTCDGIVEVSLTLTGNALRSFARISSGPPDYAPDSFPVRTFADELEQALLGPEIAIEDATLEATEEIVRRAFETIRLQNTAALNGNLGGSSMAAHDQGSGRAFEPIMAPALVDNLALRALHQSIVGALDADTAAWFGQVLRDSTDVGDLTNRGRRKMPAMMRGADGEHLALTRRQVDTVRKSGMKNPSTLAQPQPAGSAPVPVNATATRAAKPLVVQALEGRFAPAEIAVTALLAQAAYRAAGNPPGTLATTAISNCFPGLEFDFRNAWRRIFVEAEIHEYDFRVVTSTFANIRNRRLVRVQIGTVTHDILGPVTIPNAAGEPEVQDSTPLEAWNSLIALVNRGGEKVRCDFANNAGAIVTRELTVRSLFAPGTAAIAADIAEPGELTQSLCSPWQNDYKECGCYYWAASRPDYVNVEPGPEGASAGHNWMQRRPAGTPKQYATDAEEARLISYDDLFRQWETALRFVVGGNDSE
ncbi:MAG: hypothetical protein ABI779_12385 [Acidobacteriota bacterium]